MAHASLPNPTQVEATLTYLVKNGQRPVNYAFPPPDGKPLRSGVPLPTAVRIENARALPEPAQLDREGFQLVSFAPELEDFSDDAAIAARYYPEVEALLRRELGASKVVIFDHTKRFSQQGHEEQGVREPVQGVHNDQTFVSGPRRVRDHLPAEEAEARASKRHAIVNVWRPIGTAAVSWPLALCDARSIDFGDLIPTDLVYRDKVGETYSFAPNPGHRWLYYPALQTNEALLLKIYDSKTDGTARLTAHTAFADPNTPADAPPRRSIEVRTLVFWD